MQKKILFLSAFFLHIAATSNFAQFGPRIDCGIVQNKKIREASGIAASRANPGVLWVHNDSGDKNRIFAMNERGKHLGVYYLDKCAARDWEDIAIGPGPIAGKSYIYVGDIGDNHARNDLKYVYRFVEPAVATDHSTKKDTIYNIDILRFRYPDGMRDAEALMVDPFTNDYYIISKRDTRVHVYRAAYPQPLTDVDTLACIDTLNLTYIVAADISSSGTEIIMKDYDKIYYWKRTADESIKKTLLRPPLLLPYTREPQGEGLAWDRDGSGYYTISEEVGDEDCHLYFYPRLNTTQHK